jgi:hypothetical protein
LGSSPSSARIAAIAARASSASRFGFAHHQQIIRIADQHPVSACRPLPVEPMQVDVAQDRRNHAALRGAAPATFDRAVLQDPGPQHRAQELQEMAVNDPFLDRRHQPRVRNRLKTVGDVRLGHPSPAPPGLVNDDLQRVVS